MQDATALQPPQKEPNIPPNLADVLTQLQDKHEGLSGFHLLKTGGAAFTARLALIQASQHRLHLQYYILQDDLTGKLLVEELLRAADRGVKVCILLDDLDFRRARESIMILDAHENIEIRIFNPAITRYQRWINKLFRFSRFFERYSKRMHNKVLISDSKMAVVGGRNLGDEYFDARAEFAFNDLDVLVIGSVIDGMEKCFERYWNAKAAYTLHDSGVAPPDARLVMLMRITLRKFYDEIAHLHIVSRDTPADMLNALCSGKLALTWAEAEFTADSPDKVYTALKEADSPPMRRLEELLENANDEFVAVSPYFIPGKQGTRIMDGLVKRGVAIRILTNSLASTDISAVHAVYSRYRTRLLRQGVKLYELKPMPGKRTRHNLLRKGSSRSSLHAKVYVVDREWVMIGSMNLDPRSWRRNTETVITMRNPQLAGEVITMFENITKETTSFHLRLIDAARGLLEWRSEDDGKRRRYHHDPHPGWLRRLSFWLFYHFAPEDQL